MIAPLDCRSAVLNVAHALRWVRETQGPNHGEVVDRILASVGLPVGSPWCAAFVSFVGQAALNGAWPLPMVGGCVSLYDAAAAKGLVRPFAQTGAVFLLWNDKLGRFAHTGFVTGATLLGSASFPTIEGNTSPDGSPEGTGVFVRARTFGAKDRFIHWWEDPTVPAATV